MAFRFAFVWMSVYSMATLHAIECDAEEGSCANVVDVEPPKSDALLQLGAFQNQTDESQFVYRKVVFTFKNYNSQNAHEKQVARAFQQTVYNVVCPKAASYMHHCSSMFNEADGTCTEWQVFKSQGDLDWYQWGNYHWLSRPLFNEFNQGASFSASAGGVWTGAIGKAKFTEFRNQNTGKCQDITPACSGPYPYPKPDNNDICYKDRNWAAYLHLGYWGKDNCVCEPGAGICEKTANAAKMATVQPYRSWWFPGHCTVRQC